VSDLDPVFRALADPSRRSLLDSLSEDDGQSLQQLCAGLRMTRQSVSKHLAVLEAANLLTTVRRGREKLHYLNPVPVNEIAERWIHNYDRGRVRALADLKTALEDTTMDKPEFVYTTYINTTPEKLWQALTDPAFTERWWRTTFASEWEIGSTVTWETGGVTIADPEQIVLEYDPYQRLAYTWHTFTPEVADLHGFTELLPAISAEPRSKATFDLEPVGEMVKLTVTHDGFEPGSTVLTMVSQGWPQLLSSLKTFLETGETLPTASAPARQARRVRA
jgi:uncharacterized protein YndB with AHSA1/START domain/DNA-binding transcriptional ArsR family regulator